mmetsp:Transcript_42131/g.67739  ORF Transcript_42131/g.67739 Transcript_42131/m.67739 type:complete len:213 (-) Transcript_42131:453-1091(-)|eukprot:CAMPEP_0197024296 /NCGR_PEP_ID=MMETSP1384-20130603/4872_1 /TAXON_ID=29189 /ORGANISM="Ammonia sp." /LENGTH=212 /DNA_ID=CAMNT_0042452657 /DNA_START=20 /DNA_END=658 /DNA_ORIENTATION=+
MTAQESEAVELHFELEMDARHAFSESVGDVMTQCIVDICEISPDIIYFDGIDEIEKNNEYFGLLRGHIPTTKHAIETLVAKFYNSLQHGELKQKVMHYSGMDNCFLEIRELYETDQNDEDDGQYIDEMNEINLNMNQSLAIDQPPQQPYDREYVQPDDNRRENAFHKPMDMDAMLQDLKELLDNFIEDTETEFDALLDHCQKQMNESIYIVQ